MRPRLSKTILAFAAMVGVLLGLGSYTFNYAEGLSYLSNNPQTCVNCHIMNDEFNGWTKSSHHAVATCNDCHLTHSFPQYYIDKGMNGWNHSKAFTLQNFHEPIMINDRNSRILQGNCLRCHGELVHNIVAGNKTDISSVKCVTCHVNVGHGPVK
jgi:cytochrome c nitrite reductase small subunit